MILKLNGKTEQLNKQAFKSPKQTAWEHYFIQNSLQRIGHAHIQQTKL